MDALGVGVDLGTSGLRAQAHDLASGRVLSTVITARHPFPGANVMDHLHFALEVGVEAARALLLDALDRVLSALRVPAARIARLAVCGNPVQLSLFEGTELRDLAFAGRRKLEALGVTEPRRDGAVLRAGALPGLRVPAACEVVVPPAVRHEVGADAIAMILHSGIATRGETAVAIDLGTNAELALAHRGKVVTASAAAGPAIEGQQIACGTLAVEGAIADLERAGPHHRLVVLDAALLPTRGALVDLRRGGALEEPAGGVRPVGVTGTGVVAAIAEALEARLVSPPRVDTPDARLHLGDAFLSEGDVVEAGKAVGAIRAGILTLCHEVGAAPRDVETVYLSGASGTYVDPRKALLLGLLPPRARTVHQLGNTSLLMAGELARDPRALERMRACARALRASHCMLATSQVFQRIYVLELSAWSEGMPMAQYRALLARYGYPDLPPPDAVPDVRRRAERDIADLGALGLAVVADPGRAAAVAVEGCDGCAACVDACPTRALSLDTAPAAPVLTLRPSACLGVACRRCDAACPRQVFALTRFFGAAAEVRS